MKSLLDMSPDEIEEMREAAYVEYVNRKGQTVDPPWWAKEMDDDEKFQREMGAKKIWIECAYCKAWTKSVSSFCSKDCKLRYIEQQKLNAQLKHAHKMRRLMNE